MRKIILTICLVSLFSNLFAQQVLKVGQTLPNIALLSTKGTVYDFKAQKAAKGFIVVFMTPTCDHCIMYENRVMALDKKYKTKWYFEKWSHIEVQIKLKSISVIRVLAVFLALATQTGEANPN